MRKETRPGAHSYRFDLQTHIKHAFFLAILACLLTTAASCSKKGASSADTLVMGTRAEITVYGLGDDEADRVTTEAFRELHRIESVMSTWKSDSEISLVNSSAAGRPVKVSAELFGIIEKGFEYSKTTAGAFDITARPLVVMWGFQGGGPSSLPDEGSIQAALKKVGYTRASLDRQDTTVTLMPGMEIDLAGIAKGYGVDRCADILEKLGVTSALVNVGGNMYAIGAPPGRKGWTVGIREPHGGSGIVGKILIRDEAVSTSGNYENYVEIGGKRYGHILDPRTGRPADGLLSVTVVAPDATQADALSTGLFVLGYEEGSKLVESLPGVRAVFALKDGKLEKAGEFGDTLVLE